MATNSIKLLTGNSHPQLAKQVADRLVLIGDTLGHGMRMVESRADRHRLGIELAKTMSLNYSNQETSVTVGESVRDEDGTFLLPSPRSRSSQSPYTFKVVCSLRSQSSFSSLQRRAISMTALWNSSS
jgi:phosphoribosylpyrophosphate synthetase